MAEAGKSLDPVLVGVGGHLRQVRTDRGLTQDQLAKLSGVHRVTIGLLESGQKDVQITTLVRLAQALDVPVGDLLT